MANMFRLMFDRGFSWMVCLFLGGSVGLSGVKPASSQELERPRQSIILSAAIPDALKAAALIEELNCNACHRSNSAALSHPKPAPRLLQAATRLDPYYVRRFVQSPHSVKPGTSMPDAMAHLSVEEKTSAAEAITQFLLSLDRSSQFEPQAIDPVAAEVGKGLFHSVGCVACHSPRDDSGSETLVEESIPLGQLETKYNYQSLVNFIQHPHALRPGGRMPDLRLPRREVEQIASYLLANTQVPGHLKFTAFRGKVWEGLDANVDRVAGGLVDDFQLASLPRVEQNSAIVYEGFLNIERAGDYKFFLEMNGGRLEINAALVVDVPASNRRTVKSAEGTSRLFEGWNAIRFTYFHVGQEPRLNFEMEGPGVNQRPIPAAHLSISPEGIEAYKPMSFNESLVLEGKQKFVSLGCAECHDDLRAQLPLPASAKPDLSELHIDQGCLSGQTGAWPSYRLGPLEVQILRTFIPQAANVQLSKKEQLEKSLVTFNCIACHQRGELGGIAPNRNHFFTGTRPELGNDGRIPPPLDRVGQKLDRKWLAEVVLRGESQRPYLATKMPVFGENNVGHLPQLFAEVDAAEFNAAEPLHFEPIEDIQRVKEAGRMLIGAEGFSCIACHDFNGQRASGPGALDIIQSTERLQKDWFYEFLLDPARFRRGTIMPAAWPGGHVFKTEILDGDAKKQIESIWIYLQDGTRAKNPTGLSRQAAEIRVTDVAEVCRGRGPAGYRGMAVGYPTGVNLAFDTEQMNLRMLWKKEFVSVNLGSFQVRGSERIDFPAGVPFHRLQSLEDNWPYKRKTDYLFPQDHGYRFRGYFLDQLRRPTFMYDYGYISVQEQYMDRVTPEGQAYFERHFSFESPSAQTEFYFRAASSNSMKEINQGGRRLFISGPMTVQIFSPQKGMHEELIRRGEEEELLVRLNLPQGKSKLVLEYRW